MRDSEAEKALDALAGVQRSVHKLETVSCRCGATGTLRFVVESEGEPARDGQSMGRIVKTFCVSCRATFPPRESVDI